MVTLRYGLGVPGRNSKLSSRMLKELLENAQALAANASQTAPTASSTPEAEEHKSNIPEIDGSSAAFIAIVVSLAVIILICCGVVYYLLRTHPRRNDPSRGLYTSTKSSEAQPWERSNDAFASDSDDDDVEKSKYAYHGARASGAVEGNVKPSSTGQITSSFDDPFDPEKLHHKPGEAVPSSQS